MTDIDRNYSLKLVKYMNNLYSFEGYVIIEYEKTSTYSDSFFFFT